MTDHDSTDTEQRSGPAEDIPADPAASPATPQPAEAEATGMPAVPDEGAPAEEEPAEEAEEPAGQPAADTAEASEEPEPLRSPFGAHFSSPEPTAVVARPRRRATRPAAAAEPDATDPTESAAPAAAAVPAFISFMAPAADAPAPAPRRRGRRAAAESSDEPTAVEAEEVDDPTDEPAEEAAPRSRRSRSRRRSGGRAQPAEDAEAVEEVAESAESAEDTDADEDRDDDRDDESSTGSRRRRRGRRGRGRGRSAEDGDTDDESAEGRSDDDSDEDAESSDDAESDDEDEESGSVSSTRRRRRRRRRGGSEDRTEDADDDDRPERAGRGNSRLSSDDDVRGVAGSTRLEAKRQRRRDGRDTGRRRAPILTEAEFLARREAVDRAMVIRQRGDRTQIAVLEDDVLVEHYVTQASATSFAGNVYLGRVQNVLPSMEAAFVDIGKGRNAVLYAGEVNWDAAGLSGKQRSIETALKSGDKVLVQVTKDPIGHKGARLTQQINLPGRFLVFVPGGSMTGISRKLPDTERQRLKDILKKIVPEDAGVIIRTAAEGASEEELTRDVNRLTAQWEVIRTKAESLQNGSGNAPTLLYGEPDLAIRVIRDVFNEDFKELVVQGDDAWDTVEAYVAHVSPELSGRLSRYTGEGDVFHDKRIDEQLAKALDRKVWLPSGGSLVIDRTEAMTVVDVNTGKFTGSGGNLEQTVTRNNMEAAEEIVRQLRLRDIGGIIVIDFIDMVLESNRDLVLRRLTECLGRDRTKHQVAEVTSLGLVQMTRKRVGQGLLEVFSEPCEHCRGRGVVVHTEPVDDKRRGGGGSGSGSGSASGGGSGGNGRRDRSGGKDTAKDTAKDTGKDPRKDTVEEPATEPAGDVAASTGPAADEGSGDDEGSGRSGGRRSRGRRGRGQAGEERAAEDAAALTGGDEAEQDPAAEDTAAEDTAAEDTAAEDTAADYSAARTAVEAALDAQVAAGARATDVVDVADLPQVATAPDGAAGAGEEAAAVDADATAGVEPAATEEPPAARPRRRRAASRPAGPPV